MQRSGTTTSEPSRWNSNLHAFEELLRAVPVSARCGLDVGCGEGETARRLRQRVPSVVGLDHDLASIELARSYGDDVDYLHGNLDDADLPIGAFGVVTKEVWQTPAPKLWPPPLTYADTRAASLSVLPDCQFRRVGYFRYGLTWVRPTTHTARAEWRRS